MVGALSNGHPIDDSCLLTEAEQCILEHLLAGYSNSAIAQMRTTSARTVANQIATIYRKIGVNSRRELAARVGDSADVCGDQSRLSDRERLAIEYAMRGWSDKSIADALGASTSCIGALLSRARKKLRLSTRVLVPKSLR